MVKTCKNQVCAPLVGVCLMVLSLVSTILREVRGHLGGFRAKINKTFGGRSAYVWLTFEPTPKH